MAVTTQTEPETPEAAETSIEGRSPWRLAWERLREDKVAMASVGVIILIGLMAIFGGVVSDLIGHPPNAQYRDIGLSPAGIPQPPSSTFWFGTDALGRDVFVRVFYGSRISLLIGFSSAIGAVIFGTTIGLMAGYYGGWVDSLLSRALDVILSMPFLLFALALAAVLGSSIWLVVGVIVFFSMAAVGRIVRGQTLSIKEKEYVEAARSLGASDRRIMFTDILPNVLAPVLVYATLLIPVAISFSASLSFLGLGVPPGIPAWGVMIQQAIEWYTVAPWLLFFPGAALVMTTLAFNLLGDGVRDAIDPKAVRLIPRKNKDKGKDKDRRGLVAKAQSAGDTKGGER